MCRRNEENLGTGYKVMAGVYHLDGLQAFLHDQREPSADVGKRIPAKQILASTLGPMRLPFLLLTFACVILGLATSMYATGTVNRAQFILAALGATMAHICVNAFNEYFDFRNGLDAQTHRTPFSGGSGILPNHPAFAPVAFAIASTALIITCTVGVYFLYIRGMQLLPLGALGVLLICMYTPLLLRQPWVCLFAPGIGFGLCMVMGMHVALTGHYSPTAFFASLVPFFFVSNLLLLNQLPDINADRSVGRRHIPIVIGPRGSVMIYGLFLLLGYISLGVGVAIGYLPKASLLGVGTIIFAVPALLGAMRHSTAHDQLVPSLGLNVLINITTPVLMAVGLFMASH